MNSLLPLMTHFPAVFQPGRGLGAAGVRAGFRFGQAEAGERLAGGQQRQPFLLLGLGAEAVDGHGAEGDAGLQGDGDGLVHPAQLFQREGQGEVVPAHAAELLREGQAEQAHVRHLGDDFVGEAVFLVVLGGDRCHHFVGEFADGVAEVLVFLAELKICHAGPSLRSSGWVLWCRCRLNRGSDAPACRCPAWMVASTWSALTRSPVLTLMCTVPARGAPAGAPSSWPPRRAAPGRLPRCRRCATDTDTTVPGIGERTAGSAAPSSRSMAASTRASRASRVSTSSRQDQPPLPT